MIKISWEEISAKTFKCPCGKGKYTVRELMADWNRNEEHWEMNCPTCKKKYQLYKDYNYDNGISYPVHMWISKELYKEMEKNKKQLKQTKKSAVKLAKNQYMDKWLSYFQDAKTKREVWRKLTDNGDRDLNLSTFYSHIKNEDIVKYLREYFNYNNLHFILNKLGISDYELNRRLYKIKRIEVKIKHIKNQFRNEGFN